MNSLIILSLANWNSSNGSIEHNRRKKIYFGAEICFVAIIAEILQSASGICNEAEFWISALGEVDLAVWGELRSSVSECCLIFPL